MIPLRDSEEISTFPVVTIIIIAINVVVYVLMQFVVFASPNPAQATASMYFHYGLVPYELTTGNIIYPTLTPVWLMLITSMFLHGSLMHIAGNMLFFWIFGNNIEDYMGKFWFILFYLAAGIVAAFAQIMTNPASEVPVIGASGAIAGVMGAYFYLFPRARIKTLVFLFYFFTFIQIPAFIFLLIWFLMQLSSGFLSFGSASGVAFWAHVGGFAFGFVFAILAKLLRREQEN